MEDGPEHATQVPAALRPVTRWRVAFRVWALSTALGAAIGTPCVLLLALALRHVLTARVGDHPVRLALTVVVVCGVAGFPTFLKVLRSYPPGRAGAWHRTRP